MYNPGKWFVVCGSSTVLINSCIACCVASWVACSQLLCARVDLFGGRCFSPHPRPAPPDATACPPPPPVQEEEEEQGLDSGPPSTKAAAGAGAGGVLGAGGLTLGGAAPAAGVDADPPGASGRGAVGEQAEQQQAQAGGTGSSDGTAPAAASASAPASSSLPALPAKRAKYGKLGKDPGVQTEFLPDKDREKQEEELKARLRKVCVGGSAGAACVGGLGGRWARCVCGGADGQGVCEDPGVGPPFPPCRNG